MIFCSRILNKILDKFKPEVIVTQCGGDSLYGDPIDFNSPFNLTINGYCECVKLIIDKKIPTIFLGGGGYNFANTSRLWCSIIGILVKKKLSKDIPEHENFLKYGPDYELHMSKGLIKNSNSLEDAENILKKTIANLDQIETIQDRFV